MKFTIEPFCIDFEVYFSSEPRKIVDRILKRNPDEAIKKELKKDWIDDDGAGASACAGKLNGEFVIISIFDKEAVKDMHESYLAHEAVHVLSYVMKHTGVKYDCNNDEIHAYIVDSVVRMMMKAKLNKKV